MFHMSTQLDRHYNTLIHFLYIFFPKLWNLTITKEANTQINTTKATVVVRIRIILSVSFVVLFLCSYTFGHNSLVSHLIVLRNVRSTPLSNIMSFIHGLKSLDFHCEFFHKQPDKTRQTTALFFFFTALRGEAGWRFWNKRFINMSDQQPYYSSYHCTDSPDILSAGFSQIIVVLCQVWCLCLFLSLSGTTAQSGGWWDSALAHVGWRVFVSFKW